MINIENAPEGARITRAISDLLILIEETRECMTNPQPPDLEYSMPSVEIELWWMNAHGAVSEQVTGETIDLPIDVGIDVLRYALRKLVDRALDLGYAVDDDLVREVGLEVEADPEGDDTL